MKRYDPALAHPLKSECVQGFLVSVAFTENVMRERGDCLAPDSVCEVVFAFVVVAALVTMVETFMMWIAVLFGQSMYCRV